MDPINKVNKEELVKALKGQKILVRDLGGADITIATGGAKSVVVKVIGYAK